jgi:MFS family permease
VIALTSEKTNFNFNRQSVMAIIKDNKHFILPEIFDNLGQDAGTIWSLFIFVTGLTILDLGLLGVISGIIGIVVTHFTGYLIDRWDKHKVIRFGAIFTTLSWLASYLIAIYYPTPSMLYLITALRGFAIGVFAMSYGAVMMNRARNHDSQFLVLREVPTILGRLIIFSLAILFISINKFELVFLLVSILSTYFWFNNIKQLTKSI